MSISLRNPTDVVTEQRLKDFYDGIYPYLGSTANAGFTPIGTVISVMGITAPANYLICDGTVYNIADYLNLANYFEQQFGSKNKFGGDGITTFAVPDLRGEFLRGTGTNSHTNQGNGAAVGTHQDATEHTWVAYNGSNSNLLLGGYTEPDTTVVAQKNGDKIIMGEHTRASVSNVSSSTNTATKAYASRPTNTSVLYCIATKNIYLNPNLQYNYSNDEQVVGVWIDGKPLYQKTFSATATTYTENGNRRIFNITLDNSINIKNGFGIITITNASTAAYIGVELYVGSTAFATDLSAQYTVQIGKFKTGQGGTFNNSLVFACELSIGVSSFDYIVTVQYTKTTD